MPPLLTVRLARPADLPRVDALRRASYGDAAWMPGIDVSSVETRHDGPGTVVFLVERGDELLATTALKLVHRLAPLREGHETTVCGGLVDVLLRPDDVVHDDYAPLRARIVERVFRGADFLYTLELPSGRRLLSLVPSHHDHRIGEQIGVRLATDHVVTFPPAAPQER